MNGLRLISLCRAVLRGGAGLRRRAEIGRSCHMARGEGRASARLWPALTLSLALLGGGQAALAAAECLPTRLDLRGESGQSSIQVSVADTPGSRAQGLMFVEKMPRMSGMLFVYESEAPVAFWMKNTLIPLDMIFMDASGTVVHVHENAKPLDETPVPSLHPVQFVLELNGGMAAHLRIAPGSVMRHPAVGAARAAWPCS